MVDHSTSRQKLKPNHRQSQPFHHVTIATSWDPKQQAPYLSTHRCTIALPSHWPLHTLSRCLATVYCNSPSTRSARFTAKWRRPVCWTSRDRLIISYICSTKCLAGVPRTVFYFTSIINYTMLIWDFGVRNNYHGRLLLILLTRVILVENLVNFII